MDTENESTLDVTDESRLRAIFLSLVTLQDQGIDVRRSRQRVAEEASITVEEVQTIERMGIEQGWPPLD
jgi:hypothetical protein